MKTLITTFALGFITCAMPAMAEVHGNQKKSNTLTVKQAAEIVKKANETRQRELDLSWLTSIDQDVAGELSHYKGLRILLGGLTSIDANVAHELTKRQFSGLYAARTKVLSMNGLTSITKDVAHELVKKANETEQDILNLNWLTSIDQDVARELSHYGGQKIFLDGLTSITQEVAHELTKVQPGRFGWYTKGDDTKTPRKSLSLDGLTAITKEVARELAKCNGDLDLNYVKSMDSGVARELAKFKGNFLNIQYLESIATEDMNILKDGLRGRGGSEKFYRAMMPYKLNDGTLVKKWNGKIIEYRKDGSKMRETVYTNSYVVSRTEWNEEGKLTKAEKYAVDGFFGMEGQSVDTDQENKDPQDSTVQLSETPQDSSPPSTPNVAKPEREYLPQDIIFQAGIPYLRGENEPFTGICVVNWQSGSKRLETRYQNGKPVLKSTWDEDGNLIEKETY